MGSLSRLDDSPTREAIVVDNASIGEEDPEAVCRRHGARLVRLRRNRGYGAAANVGSRYARGRFVAVANTDIRFEGDILRVLVNQLECSPGLGVVGPQLVYPDGCPQPSARRYPRLRYVLFGRRSPLRLVLPDARLGRAFLYRDAEASSTPVSVEAVIGTFMVFRRGAFDAVGGFDERYFMFAEDVDICRRLRGQGWDVMLVPGARLEHYYGGVRRRHRRFTEFHRIKALCRFLAAGRSWPVRGMILLGGFGYLALGELAGLAGVYEFEYSWRLRETRA